MGSGMNLEEAKEYAKTMTYSEAVANVKYSKFIKYRKATMIKLHELAEIADKLDKADASQMSGLQDIIDRLEYVIRTGVKAQDGNHPISAEIILSELKSIHMEKGSNNE